ncbi:MAG: mechanosensitive ion channel family protein [Fimbriimonadaceae bacterium]|nr:mechanosensitive ion channel family protein [Fimbriimonadaceae bacterium]
MLDQLTQESRDWVDAGLILAAFWIPAILLRMLWGNILSPWIKRSNNPDLVLLLRPLRFLVIWTLLLSGLNYGFQSLNFAEMHPSWGEWTGKGLSIAWVLLAMMVTNRFTVGWFKYQARKSASSEEDVRDRVQTPQKLTTAGVLVVGSLFILRLAGIDISPLLAGGAVGGIIIGLALQDSLSNVFAGLFLNMDRPFRVGELLRLDQDREGFVEEVGWRYTKVRLWNDSLLVIPNKKFGESSFVNYNRPVAQLSVSLDCSVAYDSDLEKVERVAIAAAREAQDSLADEPIDFEPYVRWRAFGEYAVQFRVFLRCDHPTKQYRAVSTCLMIIHRRFKEEGIEIPVPELRSRPAKPA